MMVTRASYGMRIASMHEHVDYGLRGPKHHAVDAELRRSGSLTDPALPQRLMSVFLLGTRTLPGGSSPQLGVRPSHG